MDFKKLEQKIVDTYTEGVSLEEAERLAAEFLYAQMVLSSKLRNADLDARMKKQGVKSIRAALYTKIKQGESKVTEAGVSALLDVDRLVIDEQTSLDTAEVDRDEVQRMYDICVTAHVYFRQISRGSLG